MAKVKDVRNRAWHFLNCDVAAVAGITIEQLQQFVAGSFTPTNEQLSRLARRMGLAT